MPGFDAYHKWMGIPPEDQPADHYRLLGLVRFESDRDVIDASVNKQMSYLRICAKGEHGDLAEEILNQVSQARLCLLDARQKRVYDARLRGSASAAPQTQTTDWSIETETAAGADRLSRENAASASDSVPGRNRATASFSRSGTPVRQPDRKSRPFRRDWSDRLQTRLRQPFVWIPAVCLLVAVVIVSLLSSPSDEDPSPGLADADGTVGDTTDRTDQTVIAAGSRHSTESSGAPPEPTVAPFDATQARYDQQEWANYLGTPVETTNSIGMKLKLIPPGEFQMGSGISASEIARLFNTKEEFLKKEHPQHLVKITKPFYLSVYEVTQRQYEKTIGNDPSKFKGLQNPVEQVNWDDAVEFCRKLSELPVEKSAGYVYRLPTEAEWEYACRAGTTTKYNYGDNESELGTYAWYRNNSGGTTHPVGGKKPNAWGLYDMHGNVYEWCQDLYGYYPSGSVTDPQVTTSIRYRQRLLRGGAWFGPKDVRSASRFSLQPDFRSLFTGFRVARTYDLSPAAKPPAAKTVGSKPPPPAIAPFAATQARQHQQEWADYLGTPVETTNSIGMKLKLIPPGEFIMGGKTSYGPAHMVTLTEGFQLSVYEVTQEQYGQVMGKTPSAGEGPLNPVRVSWDDAVEFCRKLSELPEERSARCEYRLPTEAEWEYACRAGTTTRFSFGDEDSQLGEYGWFRDNAGQTTHPVGQKKPNPWGLYDMHGNLFEWCRDIMGPYPSGAVTNPTCAETFTYTKSSPGLSTRVCRGGYYYSRTMSCRSVARGLSTRQGIRVAGTFNLPPVVKAATE